MPESYELKPNKRAFVTFMFAKRFIFFLILFIILYFVITHFFPVSYLYFVIAFIFLEIFSYISLSVQYKKEKYIFLPNKIIRKSGGIFFDHEVELIVRNITHVTLSLPFLENKLFHTGDIRIESAGTGITEISLLSIDNPKEVYEFIERLMRHNGFKLTKSKLIEQESPATLGIIFEVLKNFGALLFLIFLIALASIANLVEYSDFFYSHIVSIIAVGVLILLGLFLFAIFNFLDLKNRVYNLYSDTITYNEGFLSKNYSFVPIENLSDSTLTQTFIERIFGLYDIRISCQGSGQEIHFKNLKNGPKLVENIDRLISKSDSLVREEKQKKAVLKEKVRSQSSYKAQPTDNDILAEYRMDKARTLVPLVFLITLLILVFAILFIMFGGFLLLFFIFPLIPFVILGIFFLVRRFIRMMATRYLVKSNSVEKRYTFLSRRNIEFSDDKIMAVVFEENFIDNWFNTCSINFWSIGTNGNIKFKNIKKTPELYDFILERFGMRNQEVLYNMNSKFKVSEMFKSSFLFTILSLFVLLGSFIGSLLYTKLFLIPIGIIVLLYVIIAIYKSVYYNRSKLTFYKDFIYLRKGIFFVEHSFALYDNIKDITIVKYPFSKFGTIKFNVAGEQLVQDDRSSLSILDLYRILRQNFFKINYIENIDTKDELIDMIFYIRPTAKQIKQMEQNIQSYVQKPILVSKPDLANSLAGLLILCLFAIPAIIFFPVVVIAIIAIIALLVIWSVKVKSYLIQPYRVVAKSGILYKKQKSVVFNKIDHLAYHYGVFNKMFRNGTIKVNTIGGFSSELVIKNIPNVEEFYNLLKKYY